MSTADEIYRLRAAILASGQTGGANPYLKTAEELRGEQAYQSKMYDGYRRQHDTLMNLLRLIRHGRQPTKTPRNLELVRELAKRRLLILVTFKEKGGVERGHLALSSIGRQAIGRLP